MAEKAPAFQFYIRDWRSSRKVQVMSFKERGMYLEMLIEQWDKGAAPASPAACRLALGGTEGEWTRSWPALSACFSPRKRDGGLVNAKLEAIRRDKRKYLKAQSLNGLAGAEARWRRDGGAMPSPESGIAKNGSASALASASASASANKEEPPVVPLAGGRITKKELRAAKNIRDRRFGRCNHDPACASAERCVEVIALELRTKAAS